METAYARGYVAEGGFHMNVNVLDRSTLEDAMQTAAKKHFGQDRAIEATYNEEKQVVEVFQTLTVVERVEVEDPVKAVNQISLEEAGKKGIEAEIGDELLFQIFYRPEDEEEARVQDERYGDILRLKTYRKGFGRIAAQTAKQVIIQRTRDAERENVFNDYKDRKGEIVSGIALRFERGNIIVNLAADGSATISHGLGKLPASVVCMQASHTATTLVPAAALSDYTTNTFKIYCHNENGAAVASVARTITWFAFA